MEKHKISAKKSANQKKQPNSTVRYTGIAGQMLFIILAGVFVGIYLDKKFSFGFPLFTLLLSIGGVVLAMFVIIKEVSRDTKDPH